MKLLGTINVAWSSWPNGAFKRFFDFPLLKAAGAAIERSEPGLAYVEKRADGKYTVGNPSPAEATVTVTLPGMAEPFQARLAAGGKTELAAK